MWRGVALYRAGQFAQAARTFEAIDSPDAQFNLGNALAQQQKYKEAVARYQRVLQLRPGWQPAMRNLAAVQQRLKQQEAQKKNQQGEEEPPDLKPDQIEYDASKPPAPPGDDKPRMGLVQQNAEMWMRAIQTSPTDMLARKFALQQGKP
jgi:Ca-activated chloride channel family protein